jgi:hypothetical protein
VSNVTEWRWADPTGQQRLVREDELRAALKTGVIPQNAPVWRRGWTGWKPAHDVPELMGRAPAPVNGSGDVPPPPAFIQAAQNVFEGKPQPPPTGPAEPPPPPRYVPMAASTVPQIPQALGSDTKVDAPVMPVPAKPAPSPKPAPVKPAPSPKPAAVMPAAVPPVAPAAAAPAGGAPARPRSIPPPLPAAAKQKKKKSVPPPLPAAARRPSTKPPPLVAPVDVVKPAPAATPAKPVQQRPRPIFKETQRPPAGVAPPSEALPASGRQTLQVAPAPPPMPKLDPLPATSHVPAKEPSSKFPTLLMFDEQPGDATVPNATAPTSEEAPPIVVPPPEPSNVTHAVTRPPPWGEGAVQVDTSIPKSPPVPGVAEHPSDMPPPRPMELSSSDLTSEAHIAIVKAQPLAPAERPRTMLGLGPGAVAGNRAAVERAAASPPPEPLSASDVASTSKRPAQAEQAPERPPIPSPSGAKLHDLRELAAQRMQGAAKNARRAYDDLRERTKDKPPWFLPLVAGGSAFVVLILFAAGVKTLFGSSSSSSAASVAGSSAPTTSTAAPLFPLPIPTAAPSAGPMTCKTTGPSRTVAPQALISSGVEVVALDGNIALGFAPGPKEATVDLLDPSSLDSVSALHLPQTERVRRVVALDRSKTAVDVDRAGDALEGRRTIRAATPVDVGVADGGIAWAPHGGGQPIKLWSLPSADAPVQALRGEALPKGAGYVVAFRHAGAVWFGAFGGNPPGPLGGLLHVKGLGPQVGSPAIATSGNRVMVAWADRASKDEPWSVRYATFRTGEDAARAASFTLPPGGLGAHAMSPSLASLGEGRFLLVWTEGPVSEHQVRGIAFADGAPVGAPFTASSEGVNAGQGQVAVLPDGRGVVAFLAGNGHAFEVHAAPIHCGEK